jgi:hypothetical protein
MSVIRHFQQYMIISWQSVLFLRDTEVLGNSKPSTPTSKFYQLDLYHIENDCFLNLYYVTTSWNSLYLLDRELLLTRKLLNQGFLLAKLNSSLRKIYGRHHDLVDRYGISVSQMTMDMFHLSYHSRSFLIHDLSPGL